MGSHFSRRSEQVGSLDTDPDKERKIFRTAVSASGKWRDSSAAGFSVSVLSGSNVGQKGQNRGSHLNSVYTAV